MCYYSTIEEFINNIEKINIVDLIVVNNDHEQLLIQQMKRSIDGKEISFIGFRNIVVKEENRNKGCFNKIVAFLESFGQPILFHDVVSEIIENYCRKREYTEYIDIKNCEKLLCFIKF